MKRHPVCDYCRSRGPIMACLEIQLPGFRIVSRVCGNCRTNGAVAVTIAELYRRWAREGASRGR